MTLQPRDWTIIPEQTAQITRAAFPKGNIYMMMRDELGMLYSDSDFVTLFRADCGQPALSPGQLALVTVMQFAEGLSEAPSGAAALTANGRCGASTLGLEVCFRSRVNRPRL
jgi:transposase